jgi:hypothetical protein
LVNQLASPERRTSRGGKETIDHSPGAHDDVAANVVADVAHCAVNRHTVKLTELRLKLYWRFSRLHTASLTFATWV